MKTFNQLTVGDVIYKAYLERMDYKEYPICKIEDNTITYDYRETIPRWKEATKEVIARYRSESSYVVFANKTDAMRYCKAQMMKELFRKIEAAKKDIEEIKEFRKEHYELLNHEWTENKIHELETELGY